MNGEADAGKPSVFGYLDQEEVISRIDAGGDDDLSSCFFGDSLQDVENAAARVFDVGVRDREESGAQPTPPGPFGPPSASVSAALAPVPAASGPDARKPLDQDAAARRAFILGGPAALRGD
jgi:hypothetical protein